MLGWFLCLVDLSGPYEQIEHTVQLAEEELGHIFLLANCAGYARAARFEETSIEEVKVSLFKIDYLLISCTSLEFQRLMAVNYLGSAQVSHAVISSMKGIGEGGILFVSSQAGLCGIYGMGAYSASKFALRGLAESLAMEVHLEQLDNSSLSYLLVSFTILVETIQNYCNNGLSTRHWYTRICRRKQR